MCKCTLQRQVQFNAGSLVQNPPFSSQPRFKVQQLQNAHKETEYIIQIFRKCYLSHSMKLKQINHYK